MRLRRAARTKATRAPDPAEGSPPPGGEPELPAKPVSRKRYKAVTDKFLPFAQSRGVRTWNQVDSALLQRYGNHLEANGYAYATMYLELTCLKQIVGWLANVQQHLPFFGSHIRRSWRRAPIVGRNVSLPAESIWFVRRQHAFGQTWVLKILRFLGADGWHAGNQHQLILRWKLHHLAWRK